MKNGTTFSSKKEFSKNSRKSRNPDHPAQQKNYFLNEFCLKETPNFFLTL